MPRTRAPKASSTPARGGGVRSDPRRQHWSSLEGTLLVMLFITCLACSLVAAGIGWSHTLLDLHAFRQTQTAFSTYVMLQGGPWLAYETPVLGAPWAIPFEFPLYQWAVALVVKCFGIPLDQSGRLVGELFFYATLVPAYVLLGSFRVLPRHRLVFLSLLVVSPQYLYWSRSFMIESTALFCAVAYFAFALRSLERWRLADVGGAAVFGALAAMVKITTFFAFFLAAGLCLLSAWWRTGPARFSRTTVIRFVLPAVPISLFPLVCGTLWTEYADSVRAHNPLVASFLAPAALSEWTFGSAAQRLSSQPWLTLLNRTVPEVIGHGMLVVAGVALLIAARRRLLLFTVSVALFLSAPLTFTNLHVIHNYYAYANGLFLIAAVGWCVVGCLERADWRRWLGAVVLVWAICASLWRYQQVFVPLQRNNVTRILDTARIVERATTPDETVLILGIDWNPALPYYARRRALMNRDGRPPSDPVMRQALANLKDGPVGAMVVCAGALQQRPLIASWLRVTGLSPMPRRTMSCEIYTRPT